MINANEARKLTMESEATYNAKMIDIEKEIRARALTGYRSVVYTFMFDEDDPALQAKIIDSLKLEGFTVKFGPPSNQIEIEW